MEKQTPCAPLVAAMLLGAACCGHAAPPNPAPLTEADEAFLDDLERRTFAFFWETTPPGNGLTPDRWPGRSPSSIAAVGFALTSYCVGVERGWVGREAACARALATLRFFAGAPEGDEPQGVTSKRGFSYHFLDLQSGTRFARCELSSIDTALLMMGVLACREYFDGDNPAEREARELADALYRRVEWDWMTPREPLIAMEWRPERARRGRGGFGDADYRGYDEAMFLYVLAMGSPTHPIDPSAWDAFCETCPWAAFYGREHVNFAPLFGHQYPACWIDPNGLQDAMLREKGIDYAENGRRATLAQRDYAINNPMGWRGYGADIWGLTACDGPFDGRLLVDGREREFFSYRARGACAVEVVDDGTIAPTAAGGSIPFAPRETVAALRAMRDRYGDALYGEYGLLDSFNPTLRDPASPLTHGRVVSDELGWVDGFYLGIDQGPILLMAENQRTGFVWELMKRNPYIRAGLERGGFTAPWLAGAGVGGGRVDGGDGEPGAVRSSPIPPSPSPRP